MNPQYNVDPATLTEDEARAVLTPICEYSQEQHEIAKLRYLLERTFDAVYDLYFQGVYLTKEGRGWTTERLSEELTKLAYACDAGSGDEELEDALTAHFGIKFDRFCEVAESDMHNGDCTASCFTCERCWVDTYYRVDTAPPNKSIGNALLNRIIKLRQQREQNESSATTDTRTN